AAVSDRGERCRRGGGSGSGSRRRTGGGSGTGSGKRSGSGSDSGSGTGSGAASRNAGACSTVSSCGSSAGAAGGSTGAASPLSACRCAASVARKSSASGPSRMLARLRAIEHLLGKVPVRLGRSTGRVVLEHRAALHGRLGVADRLADLRVEDEIAEVLLQDLD